MDFRHLRARVKQLEDEEHMRTSPYKTDTQEAQELYEQSMKHDEEKNRRVIAEQQRYDCHYCERFYGPPY